MLLEADAKRARDAERAGQEALRDSWLACLKDDLGARETGAGEPGGVTAPVWILPAGGAKEGR